MYASVRLYHLEGDMNEAMHRVDTIFAPRLAEEPGFIAHECIVTGDDTLCSVTTFGDEDAGSFRCVCGVCIPVSLPSTAMLVHGLEPSRR